MDVTIAQISFRWVGFDDIIAQERHFRLGSVHWQAFELVESAEITEGAEDTGGVEVTESTESVGSWGLL